MSLPEPHPDPPSDLDKRPLPLHEAHRTWIRSYPVRREQLFFGRSGANRFDAPDDEYGVLYHRAESALTATALGSLTDAHNAGLLADLLDTYDYGLFAP